jgi:hypothetical protein
MKSETYKALVDVRKDFEAEVRRLNKALPGLSKLQDELRESLGYEDYRIETPVVYNRALDELGPKDRLSYILVADNPGKKEQLAVNNRYLVGQSGKLAEGFFRNRLGVDFRREVAILNKTPIHTPKTAEMRKLLALAKARGAEEGERLRGELIASQRAMAELAHRLHASSTSVLWISGYGELKEKGLFSAYAAALGAAYEDAPRRLLDRVWLFRHFSMNQFSIEVKEKADPSKPLIEELARIGVENRKRVLGW